MRFDGIEHWDHFEDETIYWLEMSDMPEAIQKAAREIDGEAYNEQCYGMCVYHALAENEYVIVTDRAPSSDVDCNIFYIDNDGDKHWFQAELPEALTKEVFSACRDAQIGKLLPQGYQTRATILFDSGNGFVSGENQAAKYPFVTWELRAERGMLDYYTPHFHADRESAEQDLNSRVAHYKQFHDVREISDKAIHLYPYSHAEAHKRGELDEWEKSFRVNVKCARSIEAAIRDHFQNDTITDGCAKSVLEEYGFKRVNFVLANSVKQSGAADLIGVDNLRWVKRQYVPNDGKNNRYFAVDTAAPLLDTFIRQTSAAYQELGLFGAEHCPGDRSQQDYTGKVLVLSTNTLREGCWSPENQLWFAHDGFGCSPKAIGRSIRSTCLGDGEMTRWNRADFVGVLDEKYLPDWAMDRLSALRAAEQERQAVYLPPSPSVYARMSDRMTECWAIYEAEMLQLPAKEIFAKAEEIAAARFCRDELTENVKSHSEDLLEYLLQTDNPLETMREQWLDEQAVDHGEEFEHALWSMKERGAVPEQSAGGMTME